MKQIIAVISLNFPPGVVEKLNAKWKILRPQNFLTRAAIFQNAGLFTTNLFLLKTESNDGFNFGFLIKYSLQAAEGIRLMR
ncbi:MAG: hypothetical protein WCP32_06155 [Bacteroidota bacterium]